MRRSREYASLQLAHDPAAAAALIAPESLTTARFESVYREMAGFGMLDLVFEDDDALFVAHAVGVDVVLLAMREGPALIWPAGLAADPQRADAVGELVTPWLLSLLRGRGIAGEYVRTFRPSAAFEQARARGFRGAVPTGDSLVTMAPFVYARRFARNRIVSVACENGALAAAVVGTVARGVVFGTPPDDFALRWYGRPAPVAAPNAVEVAIVDRVNAAAAHAVPYVVATRAGDAGHPVIVPVPVPQDHLFTFDPADAPEAARFAVVAADRAERPVRTGQIPQAFGGSGGRVALVVRDDAFFASDADTDAAEELARRLRAEGIDATIVTADDAAVRESNVVHVFGGIGDRHLMAAAETARAQRLPLVISLEPIGPYAKYSEDAAIASLRLGADDGDVNRYLAMFAQGRLRFDEIPHELAPEDAALRDHLFAEAAREALGILLAPGDEPDAFRARFPQLAAVAVTSAPVCIGPEPAETAVAALIPAESFVLLHGPLTRRSAFGYLLAALGETPFGIVVAGPVSEVDIAFTLRRVAGSNVVFLPDPNPGDIAALYRRAAALAIPALRPAGAGRLLRAVSCGAFPLVPAASPLARLVPADARFDPGTNAGITAAFQAACAPGTAARAERVAVSCAAHADQAAAFRAVVEIYAQAAAATQP